jgi:outer membrane protein OmpA-like peptidoglycan-associated protein
MLDASTGVLTLSFDLPVTRPARSNDRLILTPVLQSGGTIATFPPMIVEGRRARVSRERKERSGLLASDPAAIYLPAGKSSHYEVTLAGQDASAWHGTTARLTLRTASERCDCEIDAGEAVTSDAPLAIVNAPVRVPPAITPTRQQAILDSIAAPYPFVAPVTSRARALLAATATTADVEHYIDEHRATSITIYFGVGKSSIDMTMSDNARSLKALLDVIHALEAAPGKPHISVLMGGFASPEGDSQLNMRLAGARANVVRDYLIARSSLTLADVHVHNAGADWRGLRALVAASKMPVRADVLRIIDTYPIWNSRTQGGRLATLMNLDGGQPYRYLLERFFPKLRSAAFIKVFYENLD